MESRSLEHHELTATRSSAPDYYAVLSSVIESSKDNPAQLRNLVYELARVNLKREIFVRHPLIPRADVDRQMEELEEAIERVENSSDDDSLMLLRRPLLLEGASGDGNILTPQRLQKLAGPATLRVLSERSDCYAPIKADEPLREDRALWSSVRNALQLIGASIIGTVVFVTLTSHFDARRPLSPEPPSLAANVIRDRFPDMPQPTARSDGRAAAMPAANAPPWPLPKSYGVYAVSDGQLVELERLQMRVPDPRVFISPDIKVPSQLTLPDGKPTFVIFRRDWTNGAPEKLPVRVVARVNREMTFKDGKAVTNEVTNMWRIRSNSYELRVSPVASQPDMVATKAEDGVELPPGRYALVINGLGYDFTIAGPIRDPAQCLERTEAVGGAIYTECREPPAVERAG